MVILHTIQYKQKNFNFNNQIQNWNHRIKRMEPYHIPKQLMDYTHRGTRATGCLKLQWKD
jgi:hypothetical protein